MTPLTMASDNTVEAHSNKDTAQDPGLEVVEEVEHHLRDSNEARVIKIIKIKNKLFNTHNIRLRVGLIRLIRLNRDWVNLIHLDG